MKNRNVVKEFNALDGKTVSRDRLKALRKLAVNQLQQQVVKKIDKILFANPKSFFGLIGADNFNIQLATKLKWVPTGTALGAPRHSGIAKEALTDCGRLKPGYVYVKGGNIKKVEKKKKVSSTNKNKVASGSTKKKTVSSAKKIKKKSNQLGLFGSATINASSDRFAKMTVSELRKFTLDYYKKFLNGKTVLVEKTLHQIDFVNRSGGKIARGGAMYKEKAAVIERFEELVKKSTYNNWGDRKNTDTKDVLGYLNFKSKLTVDGKKRHVRISVTVYKDRSTLLKDYNLDKKKTVQTSEGCGAPSSNGEAKTISKVKSTKSVPNSKKRPARRIQKKSTTPRTSRKGLGNPIVVDGGTRSSRPKAAVDPMAIVVNDPVQVQPALPRHDQVTPQKKTVSASNGKKRSRNVISSNDLMNMHFESLPFTGKWAELMQDPAKNMKLGIMGKPKNGKTSGTATFANYLTDFGTVLYNFVDQGFNKSTKDIWKLAGLDQNPRAFPTDIDNLKELDEAISSGDFDIVVIDMINDYIDKEGIKPQEFKDRFIKKYPEISFILVFEVTKTGDFKGDQKWMHVVDAIVNVRDFVMYNRGRYGMGHLVVWPEGLLKADPKKYAELMEQNEPLPEPQGHGQVLHY